MSKIEIDGFLSGEAEKGRNNFYLNYKDIFDFAKDLNKFCMKYMQEQKVEWNDKHKLIIKILFVRILENYQAILLLVERGIISAAKALTRTTLETVFILGGLQKNPSLLQCYFDQHEEGTKRALKAALNFKNEQLRKHAKEHNLEGHYIQKKKNLKGKELNILSPKQWAIEADLEDFYNFYYTSYSNTIHSNLSSLNDNIDETEKERNLAFGPSENYLYETLQCCVYILINATNFTALAHNNDLKKELDVYVEKINSLDKKYLLES